jgi:tetratricopeptide (TPR) repeat protein
MVTVSTRLDALRGFFGRRPWLQATVLLLLALAILSPSLDAGFIWDDTQQIVDSPMMDEPRAPLRFFALNVVESWGLEGRGGDGVDTYRPMFFVVLWMVYQVNGADPFLYHLAVISVHLGACLLLWTLARRWLESDWAAAAVFAVVAFHPVTTEAYLWVSAVSEPLSVAGLLGACLIVDIWCRGGRAPWPAVTAAGFVMLLGLLSKEAVATALPAVTWFLWRARGVRVRALAGPWSAIFVYLAMRLQVLDGLQATGSGSGQRLEALRTLPLLVLDGLRSLATLLPVGVRHLYWDYREVSTAAAVVAAVAVGALCVVAWSMRRRLPLTPTALGVLICMLVPIALITTEPGWGGFGRYLYLPWAFIALAVAQICGACLLTAASGRVRTLLVFAISIFLGLEIAGLRHAFAVYHSEESLARTSVELQPHAPDGWEWLGNHFLVTGDLVAAARCYRRAVDIEPGIERPRHNLAAALLHLGHPAEALEHERAVVEMHGITPEGAAVAASAAMSLERWDEAASWLVAGLDDAPRSDRLAELLRELLRRHPDRNALHDRLHDALAADPDRPAASVLRPLLSDRAAWADHASMSTD